MVAVVEHIVVNYEMVMGEVEVLVVVEHIVVNYEIVMK